MQEDFQSWNEQFQVFMLWEESFLHFTQIHETCHVFLDSAP
jgi:hypothetical protein